MGGGATRAWLGALALLAVACGGDDGSSVGPDATPPPTPDADPAELCEEFVDVDLEATSYPQVIDGSLEGAGADIDVQDDSCDRVIAPFGIRGPGPDRVVALRNLTPGGEYVVRLFSDSDLAYYVATSCSLAAGGPTPGQCLLFVDGTSDSPERGLFVAPTSGTVFVVVDHFLSGDPPEMEFSLEVYEAECEAPGDGACSGVTPFCVDRKCVECDTNFACSNSAAPVCDERDNVCGPSFDDCVGDDASETGDDGPAGAVDITSQSANGNICNSPSGEADFYKFTVASPGGFVDLELDWPDTGVDIDLDVFDENGTRLGMSFWEVPEAISLTFLPAGTYFARVRRFGDESTAVSAYTITATDQGAMACVGPADCAAEFDNQLFRGNCTGGACAQIEGDGALGDAAACDSTDDCASGLCTSFFFNENADTRSVCTTACTSDAECAPLGGNYVCTDFLFENFCVQQCADDLQCPVLPGVAPQAGPWRRLTCETVSGRCQL